MIHRALSRLRAEKSRATTLPARKRIEPATAFTVTGSIQGD
jgi:hypothetical protein